MAGGRLVKIFQFNIKTLEWKWMLAFLVNVHKIIVFRGKEAEYSDEEESDTEEYKENRHKVK